MAFGVTEHALAKRTHNLRTQKLKVKALRRLGRDSQAEEIECMAQARLAE
jgi:hypothetical protein